MTAEPRSLFDARDQKEPGGVSDTSSAAATTEMTEIPVDLAHAFRDLVTTAKGVRHARKTYLGVADSEVYYERLFAALDAVEEARSGS